MGLTQQLAPLLRQPAVIQFIHFLRLHGLTTDLQDSLFDTPLNHVPSVGAAAGSQTLPQALTTGTTGRQYLSKWSPVLEQCKVCEMTCKPLNVQRWK